MPRPTNVSFHQCLAPPTPHHAAGPRHALATVALAYRCFIAIEAERDFWWYVIHFILPHAVIL